MKKQEYEYIEKTAYPIIWRKKGNEETDECPFCKQKHIHGPAKGHRSSHCTDILNDEVVYILEGFSSQDGKHYFPPKNGYILKEY